MSLWDDIAEHISNNTGTAFEIKNRNSISGGCISSAFVIDNGETRYFVKLNHHHKADMFKAEFHGLNELFNSHTIHVPQPVCTGTSDEQCYLVLEFLETGSSSHAGHRILGQKLAAMHQTTRDQFGWDIDNTIGSVPQINDSDSSWTAFFKTRRLEFQLDYASKTGNSGRIIDRGYQLCELLDGFFTDYNPVASLLHGDLWSGNYAFLKTGEPVIFDPATYYGDREADIAMTELFGGFSGEFYAEYNNCYPLDSGYKTRKTLYNLYHILNHMNMFGGGYRSQAESMINSLLSECS
ncbi:MAG: fructosamine kinase family protein [Gammaproteobacteria bacterium]|nr:fructosamine kinase family protein [Gammaproteobacteria bacterium]MDH5594233.1 fructosamine kinase family protein [Gammaproteobacteria bacterium]